MFRDSIRRFVGKLEEAGVETVASEEPGMFHVFPILMPWAEASRRVYRGLADFVAARLDAAEKSDADAETFGEGA
jgi:acetyl esterase/lipase